MPFLCQPSIEPQTSTVNPCHMADAGVFGSRESNPWSITRITTGITFGPASQSSDFSRRRKASLPRKVFPTNFLVLLSLRFRPSVGMLDSPFCGDIVRHCRVFLWIAVLRLPVLALLCLSFPRTLVAQIHTFHAPEESSTNPQSQYGVPNRLQDDVDISWRKLPKRILNDQKDIWLFPLQLAKGRYWAPMLGVAGVTAGLIAADPHDTPYFRTHSANIDDINDIFDGPITSAEIAVVPVSLLVSGYVRHNPYDVHTSMLAGEAYVDGAVVDLAIKAVTRRKRPSDVPAGMPLTDTFFSGGKSPFKGSSFPSGHAVGAFSVATVIARRYRQNRWVPWLAYGAATAISFSRVTTRSHFPSDVFLGAALGYTIARFDVLRR